MFFKWAVCMLKYFTIRCRVHLHFISFYEHCSIKDNFWTLNSLKDYTNILHFMICLISKPWNVNTTQIPLSTSLWLWILSARKIILETGIFLTVYLQKKMSILKRIYVYVYYFSAKLWWPLHVLPYKVCSTWAQIWIKHEAVHLFCDILENDLPLIFHNSHDFINPQSFCYLSSPFLVYFISWQSQAW